MKILQRRNSKRPICRERAKDFDNKADMDAKRIRIAEETLLQQKECYKLLRTQQEMILGLSPANTSDPAVNEYFTITRKGMLVRLKATETSQPSPKPPNISLPLIYNKVPSYPSENNCGAVLILSSYPGVSRRREGWTNSEVRALCERSFLRRCENGRPSLPP